MRYVYVVRYDYARMICHDFSPENNIWNTDATVFHIVKKNTNVDATVRTPEFGIKQWKKVKKRQEREERQSYGC